MMDMGFDEKDVNIQWYLGEAAPEALADVICRRTVDLDRAADELSARTRLDRDKLRSYLGDVVG